MMLTGRSNDSINVSETGKFDVHGQLIKKVRADWEGHIETEEFWQHPSRIEENSNDREIMKSTKIRSESQSVLDKQMEIFKNLRKKKQSPTSCDDLLLDSEFS
jgi:hypothetical protein